MSKNVLIAIPSDSPGGLEANRSAHFGQCDLYTLVEISEAQIKSIQTMDNPPHEHGGCLAPVQLLKEKGVNALLTGGIGQRPLMGFIQADINVFSAKEHATVNDTVSAYIKNELPVFSLNSVCGSCGDH